MNTDRDHAASDRGSSLDALAIILAIAMVMALAFVLEVGWKHFVRDTFAPASRDLLWMAPISAASFSVALLSPVVVAAPFLTRPRARATSLFGSVWLAVFAALLPWTQIHRGAAAVLAAGLASAAVRSLGSPARIALVKRTGLVVLCSLVIGALTVAGWRAWSTRRGYATLPPARQGAPNVLFLLLDTVRASSLGTYGYARSTSPALDSLAAGGVVFEQAIATAPWTLPSHATLFTGEYPGLLSTSFHHPLDGRQETLAERFRDAGYETVGFTGNLHYTTWQSGLARGFLQWSDFKRSLRQVLRSGWLGQSGLALDVMQARERWEVRKALSNPDLKVAPLPGGDERTAQELADAVLAWEERRADRPYFAFINFMDAHQPYAPPGRFRTRFATTPSDRDLYDAEIASLDQELGRLLAALRERGALRNTLIVLVSDHGEQFKEHGMISHGNSLYYPALHVPLVFRFDGHLPARRRVGAFVSLRDVPATVASLAGVQGTRPFPGTSLQTHWSPGDSPVAPPSAAISELTQTPVPLTDDPLTRSQAVSLIEESGRHSIHRNDENAPAELYDVRLDPLETRNLATTAEGKSAYHAQLERLRTLLRMDRETFGRR